MKTANTISAISQQYYIMAEHWASDLEFYKLETVFLRGLLEDHFMELCEQKYLEELKRSGKLLMDLDREEYECEQLINLQLTKLGLLAKYSLLDNKEELRISQLEIEGIVMNLTRDYQNIKKGIFKLIEDVLKQNKLRKLN